MEDIKKRISKLVDLKSIISIIMVAAMVAGFLARWYLLSSLFHWLR